MAIFEKYQAQNEKELSLEEIINHDYIDIKKNIFMFSKKHCQPEFYF